MEISVAQASNGFIQSVRMNRMISQSDADLGRPVTAYLNFKWFTGTFSLWCSKIA